jgi:hypothetical protein
MAEVFTVVCDNISCTAAQDILCAYAAATKKLQLLAVEMSANGQTTVGNYPLRIRYIASAVTPGTGGAAVTPKNTNPDGAAPSFTARRNDFTQATGTFTDWVSTQFNPINGYYWEPPKGVQTGDEPKVDSSGAVTLSLDSIAGTLNISATLWLREI